MDVGLDDIIKQRSIKTTRKQNFNKSVKKNQFKRQKPTTFKAAAKMTIIRQHTAAVAATGKILVSNLATTVSAEDLQELFGGIGNLASFPVMHFDQSGRSLGSAEITFSSRVDAQKAVQKYNGVTLDAKPLRIQQTVNSGPNGSGLANRIGNVNHGQQQRVFQPHVFQPRQVNQQRRQPKLKKNKDVNASQLDNELDQYMVLDPRTSN